jgi:tetratricopeptide (TPR) repeat protein
MMAGALDLVAIEHARHDRHAQAVEVAQRALALLPATGENLRRRAELEFTLTFSLMVLGRGDEAEARLRTLLDELRAQPVPSPRLMADALDNLGKALPPARRDEALALNAQALDLMRQLYGPDSPVIGSKLNNYATALFAAGRLREAQQAMAQVVALRRTVPDLAPSYIAHALGNLGAVHVQLGEEAQALAVLDEALSLYGEESPRDRANYQRWRAVAKFLLRRDADALQDMRAAEGILAGVFAPDDARMLRTRMLAAAFDLRVAGPGACAELAPVARALHGAPDLRDEDRGFVEFLLASCPEGTAATSDRAQAALRGLAGALPETDFRLRIAQRIASMPPFASR